MRDDSLDESKWIDFAETAVHPTRPPLHGAVPGRRRRPGHPGYRPHLPRHTRIPGIAPSKLAPRNTLHAVERLQNIFAVNVPMAFAGYGTTDYNGGNFGPRAGAASASLPSTRMHDQQWAYLEQGAQRRLLRGFRRANLRARGLAAAHRRHHQRRGRHVHRGGNSCARRYQVRSRLDQGHHRGSLSQRIGTTVGTLRVVCHPSLTLMASVSEGWRRRPDGEGHRAAPRLPNRTASRASSSFGDMVLIGMSSRTRPPTFARLRWYPTVGGECDRLDLGHLCHAIPQALVERGAAGGVNVSAGG